MAERRRFLMGAAVLAARPAVRAAAVVPAAGAGVGVGVGAAIAPAAAAATATGETPVIALPTPALPPISPSAARVVAPSAVGRRYRLVFADEFDDDRVERINEDGRFRDPAAIAWRSRYRHPRKDVINQEKQIYVDPQYAGTGDEALGIQPFSIDRGILAITAEPVRSERVAARLMGLRYTSGVITSEFTHAQQYGYFEIRARLPVGRGYWPAFWLVTHRDAWPPEIDILEASGSQPTKVHFAVHEPGPKRPSQVSDWVSLPGGGRIDGFHRYGMEWTADALHWFVDDQPMFSYRGHDIHEPMHMRINLALGSHEPNWIPDPDESTPFPGRFEIDYVRVFQR